METIKPSFLIRCFLVLLLPYRVHSQPAELQFEHISTHDGLSQDIVTCLFRDRFGFLWIGTEDGLNRYDGYSIVTYKHNPRDGSTLPNNRITGVCDYGGEDLIVTTEGGFRVYHRAADVFALPGGNLGRYAAKISAKPVRDKSGCTWLIAEYRKLLRYDPVRDSVAFFNPGSSPQDELKDLLIDRDDSLWVTSENAVSVFQGDAAGFRHYKSKHEHRNFHSPIINHSCTTDRDGNLWIGTNAGLFRNDRTTGVDAFVPLKFTEGGSVYDRDNILSGLRWDQHGRLWMGGFNGLYCFNPRTNSTARYTHNLNNPMSLQSNRVYDISIDASNVLWVGTWWGGLSKSDLRKERFGHVRHSPSTPLAGESNDIVAIYEHPAGTIWFGCQSGGVTRVNFRTGEYTQFPNNPGNKLNFCSGDVLSMTGDSENIWIAVGEKVAWYHSRTGTFTALTIPANAGRDLQIQKLHVDRTGCLWMGIEHLGIVRYEPRTKIFTDFTFEHRDTGSVPITGAWMFFEDRQGNLWAGGWGGNNVLYRFDRVRSQFDRVPKQELQSCRTAVEDNDGNLWIGTWGLGMSRYNPQTGELRQYIEQDGLPSNYVKGILIDDRGDFWASTEKGLSYFSPSTTKFRNYSTSDGLQGNLYYTGSCLKGSDGRLYFGGANGFNAFYPDSIRQEEYSPPVLLTEFRVFDKPRAFDHSLPLSACRQIGRGGRGSLIAREGDYSRNHPSCKITNLRDGFILVKIVSTGMTVKVGIIEDDHSIRESVTSFIDTTEGFSCRDSFDSVESALEKISDPPPDVLLMDINLGGMSGIEGVKKFKSIFPRMNILMLTVFEESNKIFQSLCAGASGYLLKRTPPKKILEAITEVHNGGAPMTASVARKVLDLFTSIAPPALPEVHLTARETEILQHLVSGSSYKKISRDLFISFDTVNSHIKKIYEKLQVHSKTEAVTKALKHKLV